MLTQNERVSQTLDLLASGLEAFVEHALQQMYGDEWRRHARASFRDRAGDADAHINWDAHSLLTVMWDQWNAVFRGELGFVERSLVSELREFRNRWAHQEDFNFDDTYRVMDSAHRLLEAVQAPQAAELGKQKRELMRDEIGRESSQSLLLAKFKRKKASDIVVYLMCCVALVIAVVNTLGVRGWVVAMPMACLFLYFAIRVAREKPMLYGPHECPRCGRVIYSQECPYCQMR